MSYDIQLTDPETGDTITLDHRHNLKGGTYCLGGASQAWLNVTYNYSEHFYRVLGGKGIRTIYGMTGEESIPILKKASSKLGNDVHHDYWEPTEGNARKALLDLVQLAKAAPHGVWDGD